MRLMVLLAELGCPHSTSVLAVTVHVDMPCTSSSARALTSACSGHSERAHSSVDHRPFRVLRHPPRERPDAGHQATAVVAEPAPRPLAVALRVP